MSIRGFALGALAGVILPALLWGPVALAQDGDAVATRCNLQARELALQVAEEMGVLTESETRTRFATIAESVCLDYFDDGSLTVNNDGAQDKVSTTGETENDEGDGGFRIFEDFSIIDPEDRVERPGLKRP